MAASHDIPVQCTRCRNRHMESERVGMQSKQIPGAKDMVCPRCSCKSYYDLRPQVAWCWASGLIEIGDEMPADSDDGSGAIPVAAGPKAFLKGALDAVARHGYGASSGKLLVPGVPEASSQKEACDALSKWLTWCAKGNGKKGRHGVVFEKGGF